MNKHCYLIIAILLVLATTLTAGNIVAYVDPDASGNEDGTTWEHAYKSLSAGEAAEQQDLTDNGGDIMHFYCKSSSGGDDTTSVWFDGWTTNSTCYIVVHEDGTDGGEGACDDVNGQWDANKYLIDVSNHCILTVEDVRIIGLQLDTDASAKLFFGENTDDGAALALQMSYCVCKGAGGINGVYLGGNAGSTMSVFNNVLYSSANDGAGLYCVAGTMTCYNNTVRGFYKACYQKTGGTMKVTNCAVFLNNDDFSGTITVDYCASDDEDGTNSQLLDSTDNYANEFTDSPNGDFTIVNAGSVLDETGLDDPGTGLYSDDIAGTVRSSTWDIGAFELTAAAPTEGQVIIINFASMGYGFSGFGLILTLAIIQKLRNRKRRNL